MISRCSIGCSLILAFACSDRAFAADGPEPAAAVAIEKTFTEIAARVESAVVSIARLKVPRASVDPDQFDPFRLDRQTDPNDSPDSPEFAPSEFGTGVVIAPLPGNPQRFILTNYHVVRGGPTVVDGSKPIESRIYVRFANHRGFQAKILAADPRSDLAVLAIDPAAVGGNPQELTTIPLRGDSPPLKKGQLVLGLGNPYAIARDGSPSVTWGMIGNIARRPALPSRPRDGDAPRSGTIHQFGTLLQIDARMDLGTSGGALVNLRGELVGVTTSLAALEGYEKSVGFAIPIDAFTRRVIESLCRGFEVEYGFLGLMTPNMATGDYLRRLSPKLDQASAVRVNQVMPKSPAAGAGLQSEDVILAVGDRPLFDQFDLMRNVGIDPPGSEVRLRVWRPREARELTLTAKLGKWPVLEEDAIVATAQRHPAWRGLAVDHPTGRQKYFPWPYQFKEAVLVVQVASNSPAQAAGLHEGDFIAAVNGEPVRTPDEFYRAVGKVSGEATLELADKRQVIIRR